MKISIKVKQYENEVRKRPSRLFKGQKKQTFLWHCYSFVTKKHLNYKSLTGNFLRNWDCLAWPGTEKQSWSFSDVSWFVRLHAFGTMVSQFAWWSIGSFLHSYRSISHKSLEFPSRRRLPICKRWPCFVHEFPVITQIFISKLSSLESYQHQNTGFGPM